MSLEKTKNPLVNLLSTVGNNMIARSGKWGNRIA